MKNTLATLKDTGPTLLVFLGFAACLASAVTTGRPLDIALAVVAGMLTVALIVAPAYFHRQDIESAEARGRTEQVLADSEALRKVIGDFRADREADDAARASRASDT